MYKINFVGLLVLIYKEIFRYYKVIGQTILAPVVTNGLFLIVFSITMKDKVILGSSVSYMQFLVPGLIMMGVLTNSFSNSCSSILQSKYNKTSVDFLMIPLSPLDLTLGFLIGAVTRGILVGVVTYITSIIFIPIEIKYYGITFSTLFLCSGTFALLGCIMGLKFRDYDQVATIQNFILTPLSFLGGVFYSISQLPSPFNKVALFNPISYMINSLRYGLLGVKDLNIIVAYFIMITMFLLCFITVLKMFKSGEGLRP